MDNPTGWNIHVSPPFTARRVWGPQPNYPTVLGVKQEDARVPLIIAGPCSIESPEQIEEVAKTLKTLAIQWMRGGVFRAGTYPPHVFGLQKHLLERWAEIARSHGLRIVVEVLDVRDVEYIDRYADAFQVGARHMQDYALLAELRHLEKPVTLKRHMGSTLDEFLGAAEYLCRGRCKPILVERGSSTHMNHVRWDLSVSTIAAIKQMTGIPVLVDASHGTGRRDLVEPMTLAGLSAGADGYIIETHPAPHQSLSDADQAFPLADLPRLVEKTRRLWGLLHA